MNSMKIYALIMGLLIVFNSSYSQINSSTSCKELTDKGYNEDFCKYNEKQSFKNIPLNSSYEFVSSKYKLVKYKESEYKYYSIDSEILNWAGITFDQCTFEFSPTNKLLGIQLHLNETTFPEWKVKNAKERVINLKTNLENLFGKSEKLERGIDCMWMGYNLYLVIQGEADMSTAVIAIYRKKVNSIDDL